MLTLRRKARFAPCVAALLAAFLLAGSGFVPRAYAADDSPMQVLELAPSEKGDLLPTPENIQLETSRRLFSDQEIKLLQELDAHRIELDRREQALRVREKLVDMAEADLDTRIKKLEDLQGNVEKLLRNLSNKEDDELLQLAKIYEEMKPAGAATVLDKMDNNTVFDLFKRMKRKSTAKVMEKMDPAKARRISQMLAEKSDLPQF